MTPAACGACGSDVVRCEVPECPGAECGNLECDAEPVVPHEKVQMERF